MANMNPSIMMTSQIPVSDDRNMEAKFFLGTRKVDEVSSNKKQFSHWIMLADFGDRKVYFDANNPGKKFKTFPNIYDENPNMNPSIMMASQIPVSDDHRNREAKFYVCTRKVEKLSSSSKRLTHWIMLADFGDREVYFDASKPGKDCGPKLLLPNIYDEKPGNIISTEYLDSISISPSKVYTEVYKHEHNYSRYSAISNNCQTWICQIFINLKLNKNHHKLIMNSISLLKIFWTPGLVASLFVGMAADIIGTGTIHGSISE